MAVDFLHNTSQNKKESEQKKPGFFGAEKKKSTGVNLMTSEVLREATRAIIRRNVFLLVGSFFIALIIALLAYGALLAWGSQEQKKVAIVRQELDAVNRDIAQMEKEHSNLTQFQNKLSALKSLIDDHRTLLPFFDGLEKNTLPEVFYSTLVFSSDGSASLSATTTSYTNVGRQLLAFQESKGFTSSVQFSGIASSLNQDGEIIGVNFSVLLKLDPALFKKEPPQ
ncbi:MAG: hypothetical protein Q8P56_01055 [Candidatus Uhrbacteria bacterium]|nr:hypothetical protein [Candidatus Uhrbacteria bacterium]